MGKEHRSGLNGTVAIEVAFASSAFNLGYEVLARKAIEGNGTWRCCVFLRRKRK
jgi:hypothetical protein